MKVRASVVLLACIGVGLVFGALARSAGSRAPSFTAVTSYAIGKGSGAITLADVNGDGKPDVAAPHRRSSSVSVRLNLGDGRFGAQVAYKTAPQPAALAARDLNADGKPDLVTANSGSISVLLNRGDGTFGARTDFPGGGDAVAITELNGDVYPDLVTTSGVVVSVFLNRGDGSYEAKHDYPIGGDYFHAPEVADLNGDNRPDIVTANTDGKSLSVFLNDGNGGFGARRDYRTGGAYDAVASRDLNGDGYPDLVTYTSGDVSEDYHASVFLNRGDGSFAPRRAYDIEWHLVDIVDVNADERPDLVSEDWDEPACDCSGAVGFYVRLNRGDGSFRGLRFYRVRAINSEERGRGRLADLNGDGKPELIVTRGFPGAKCSRDYPLASVFLNRGGRFQPQLDYPTCGVTGSDVADVNGDGRPDVVTSGASVVSVLINTPGLCNVQAVGELTLATASQKLARAGCRVGKVRYVHKKHGKGHVISQKPTFGAVRAAGARVNLVVSLGRKR